MYENRLGVVAVGTVLEHWDGKKHTSPLYYGDYEYRIKVDWYLDLSENPITVQKLKRSASTPRGAINRIVKWRAKIEQMIEEQSEQSFLPEEIAKPSRYPEGTSRQISVNAYERNRDAVRQCKLARGTACIICGFDFGAVYGTPFVGFIHVHHLRPLSDIGGKYVVDPVADLCPVCPNCHAIVHHGGQLRSIAEVKKLLAMKRFQETMKKPNKQPEPTSPSVTPAAGTAGAPSVSADH
jgi:hypothetical protein